MTRMLTRRYLDTDVLSAARQRIREVFDGFDKVVVAFSAGKDSSVLLHLVEDEARARGRRFGLLLIDLEGQYRLTIDYALGRYRELADVVDPHWVCLPIALRNAVSVYEPKWLCWDPDRRADWIREPPGFAVTDPARYPFFRAGMEFEEFTPAFGEWYGGGQDVACLVGIRAVESLNRYRTILSHTKTPWRGRQWTSRITEHLVNAYPIYDWRTEDIWIYFGKTGRSYNRLYDRMAQAGLTVSQMRICQPYGDDQRRGLWLYQLIEPETWARVVARVNGANTGALYARQTGNVNGYRRIDKPPGHSWESFVTLLLASMPPSTAQHYADKILLFQQWWIARGYPDGIPDEADPKLEAARKVPSWRRVCKSLLRNDYWAKGLGFTQHKSTAYLAYENLMRRRRQAWGVPDGSVALPSARAV